MTNEKPPREREEIQNEIEQLQKEKTLALESIGIEERAVTAADQKKAEIQHKIESLPKNKGKERRREFKKQIEEIEKQQQADLGDHNTFLERVKVIDSRLAELETEMKGLSSAEPEPGEPAPAPEGKKEDKDKEKEEKKDKADKNDGIEFNDPDYLDNVAFDIENLTKTKEIKEGKHKKTKSVKLKKLLEKEILVRNEQIKGLQHLQRLADNKKELSFDVDKRPEIDIDGLADRRFAEKWEDSEYIERVIVDINGINQQIDDKLNLFGTTKKAKVKKELSKQIAIRFKHLEILSRMLDLALGKEDAGDEEENDDDDKKGDSKQDKNKDREESSDGDKEGDQDDGQDDEEGEEETEEEEPRHKKGKDVKSKKKDSDDMNNSQRQESGAIPPPLPPGAFNVRTAFNRSGFREYLMEFAEQNGRDIEHDLETENYEYIQERYEAFTKSESSKKELRSLFAKEIKDDLGITLDKEAYDDIDAYIDEARKNDPREIIDLSDAIQEYRQLAATAQQEEDKLEALKAEFERLHTAAGGDANLLALEQLHNQQRAKYEDYFISAKSYDSRALAALEIGEQRGFGFFRQFVSRIGMYTTEIVNEELVRLHNQITAAVNTINPIRALQAKISELEVTKRNADARYEAIRTMLFEKVDGSKKIQRAAQKKLQDEIKGMLERPDMEKRRLSDVDDQQDLLDRARNASAYGVPEYLEEDEMEEFQRKIDEAIVLELNEEINEAINSNKSETAGAFDSLEKNLSKFALRQRLGSREGRDALDFILNTLEEKKEELKDKKTKEDSAKAIALALIIRNLRTQD